MLESVFFSISNFRINGLNLLEKLPLLKVNFSSRKSKNVVVVHLSHLRTIGSAILQQLQIILFLHEVHLCFSRRCFLLFFLQTPELYYVMQDCNSGCDSATLQLTCGQAVDVLDSDSNREWLVRTKSSKSHTAR